MLVPESALVKHYRETDPTAATSQIQRGSSSRHTSSPLEQPLGRLSTSPVDDDPAAEAPVREHVPLNGEGNGYVCGSRICSSIVGAGGKQTSLLPAPVHWLRVLDGVDV